MPSAKIHQLKNEVNLYFKVFGGLLIFTVITVALSSMHVETHIAVTLGLIVAATKASLVASFFMHLSHEKKLIYVVLGFTAFFFISMIALIVAGNYSVPEGAHNLNLQDKYKTEAHGHYTDKHSKEMQTSEKHEEAHH